LNELQGAMDEVYQGKGEKQEGKSDAVEDTTRFNVFVLALAVGFNRW